MTQAIDTSLYAAVTDAIRNEASRILSDGTVSAVIGYTAARRRGSAQPIVVSRIEDAAKLIFTPACVNNLAVYLTKAKKEVPKAGRIGVVVKGCDLKALVGLMGESQLTRERLYLIGVPCVGVLASVVQPDTELTSESIAPKCRECDAHLPAGCDYVPAQKPVTPELEKKYAAEIARLEALTPAERWSYWKEQSSKCIKCYACRQVCPFCFCEQCLCDRNKPQMVESTPRPAGNVAWHIVRAMHLAGRCAGCAECERVCPMDIPLNLLNRKMAKELKELFDHEAGFEVNEKGPLATFTEKDDQSFIK
ncbi:4Fe-4S dicluster domain-containing protein [Geobacter sp. SVR]|uniref:4Fe-4S dicluster domain-containing protein n=1 Tax=Geobacter sp. SVR TaxID=2495594 RepID=UPI00143EFA57|nr:4Fe-4S dicluster domain-containing protein [Geobacter sp. SVR]BCS55490.1 Fe-S oxidoreductase [Geobacter sp. SVR]GCF83493.1 Fe-S oxidoreductase [Geobacter sp. SVR]